ncbi:UNVERIFIED_CONTAM: Retrovirus-related Pol polyprotein from transposon RE1 [Sesamum latifolium]|uniref:Retrovirus-related Pol polyprotein from transposon RE1 n=1 Tax=Sesamum latifolium TaxID=2727402 RepID=A0AAW2WTQ0_9LAMI
MVVSWLLNSISKDIAEAFLYTTSARDLWKELKARFGEGNSPMLYEIQREIASLTQGEMTISGYYTKLKKLWDELAHFTTLPKCSCGASKALSDLNASNHLMQFLMGLGDVYDHVRNQVLLIDPLPSVGKAYSMVLRVEKQREVQASLLHDGAMSANLNTTWKQEANGAVPRRQGAVDTRSQYCDHCKRTGHTRESCFKLTGYPKWYKTLMEQRRNTRGSMNRANNAVFETGEGSSQSVHSINDTNLSVLIRQEINRMMQTSEPSQEHNSNFVDFEDFAGSFLTNQRSSIMIKKVWIIDSGASTHMSSDVRLLTNIQTLKNSFFVKLPDGTKCLVTHKGDVELSDRIKLYGVLYVPSFKHNLISVSKICVDNSLKVSFTHDQCLVGPSDSEDYGNR